MLAIASTSGNTNLKKAAETAPLQVKKVDGPAKLAARAGGVAYGEQDLSPGVAKTIADSNKVIDESEKVYQQFLDAYLQAQTLVNSDPVPKALVEYALGETVYVRDRPDEEFREGIIIDMQGDLPLVHVHGMTQGYTWAEVRREGEHWEAADSKKESVDPVDELAAKIVEFYKDGNTVFSHEMILDHLTKHVTQNNQVSDADPAVPNSDSSESSLPVAKPGDRVRVRDHENDEWRHGRVVGLRQGRDPMVVVDGGGKPEGLWWGIQKIGPGTGIRDDIKIVRTPRKMKYRNAMMAKLAAPPKPPTTAGSRSPRQSKNSAAFAPGEVVLAQNIPRGDSYNHLNGEYGVVYAPREGTRARNPKQSTFVDFGNGNKVSIQPKYLKSVHSHEFADDSFFKDEIMPIV